MLLLCNTLLNNEYVDHKSGICLQRSTYGCSGLLIHDDRQEIMRETEEDENENGDHRLPNDGKSEVSEPDTQNILQHICSHFIEDMNRFGIAVLDSFLVNERGDLIYEEVVNLHRAGLFTEGQLVRNETKNKDIRGDRIIWLVGNEGDCPNISGLINDIDNIVKEAGRYANNGLLGKYNINGRTKAMVACYPGNGAHYVKHVDNPNRDGRILTAIYYLNKNWDSKIHGGMLRIFPTEERPQAADIDPNFNRMLFFWSDGRNPHEVQPSYRTRFSITIWYLDATEKQILGYQKQKSDFEEAKTKLIQPSNEQEVGSESVVENDATHLQPSTKTTKMYL